MVHGWSSPQTALRYEAFCDAYTRYGQANQELVSHAELAADSCVVDFAAGTGRTAETALARLGPRARIVCVEPIAAMRRVAMRRLKDPRVAVTGELPSGTASFDRVLCGAALWQVEDLRQLLDVVFALLRERGSFVFTIPSLYMGEPDRPGGGRDPMLTEIWSRLSDGRAPNAPATPPPPARDELVAMLEDTGFRVRSWSFEHRLTQPELRAWLRIPVITDALLGELDLPERDARVEDAYQASDPHSYRWERWSVFAAGKG